MQAGIRLLLFYQGGEIGINTDGSGQRIVREFLLVRIHLADQFTDGVDGIRRAEGSQIHHREALFEDFRRNDLFEVGRNQFQIVRDSILVRSVSILFD